jgi:Anti-sigma-28 factor, FlgM
MSEQRALRITNLRERIDRAQYHVDVDKVAEAILGRPTMRLLIIPGATMSAEEDADPAADDGLDQPPSEDVLEAV